MGETGADAGELLIDHALTLRWGAIDPGSRQAAAQFLCDTLAVGAAGRNAAHADGVLDMLQGWGHAPTGASVLGRPGLRLPALSACFLNAFQIHGQEYDCVHEPAVLHPMATVLAALLAEVERGTPVDGATFLTALVAGVDVAVTLGLGAGPLTSFRPATAGIFGCVAAIANLRNMHRAAALDAFGHALAFASGTMQAHVEGKPALPVQVANAARGSLMAIDLARAGMSGVRHPIEGAFGYFTVLDTLADLHGALVRLGHGHRIAEVSWKPFPTGRAGHGGIVAIQELMAKQDLRADRIARLDYYAPPLIHRLVGRPAYAAMAPGYARLCLPWLAATTLLRGTVSLDDFGADSLSDAGVLALADKVSVIADDNPDPAAFVPGKMVARLVDGSVLEHGVSTQLGSPAWPLTLAQQRDKARGCLRFAGLEAAVGDALALAMLGIADAPDAVAAIRATGVLG